MFCTQFDPWCPIYALNWFFSSPFSNRQLPTTSSPIKNPSNISNRDSNPGQLDNLCQLEETDDEDLDTPIVENKPLTVAKITQV